MARRGNEVATTLAVIVAQLSDARSDINGLRSEVSAARTESVSKGEWLQRNALVDSRFEGQGREIAGLRTDHGKDITGLRSDISSKRAPWWTTASLLIAGVASFAALSPFISAR